MIHSSLMLVRPPLMFASGDLVTQGTEKLTWARFDTKDNIPQPRGYDTLMMLMMMSSF